MALGRKIVALTVRQWQDKESLRIGRVLESAEPLPSFDSATVSKPEVLFRRVLSKAARVVSKLARRS